MEIESEIERAVYGFMGRQEMTESINILRNRDLHRLEINLDKMREYSELLYKRLISNPIQIIPLLESQLNKTINEGDRSKKGQNPEKVLMSNKNQKNYKISFTGMLGKNMVSPRGLTAQLTNQLVNVIGIVTRMSIVRPKLVNSCHYCEETKSSFVKSYSDQYSLSGTNNFQANAQNPNANGYVSNSVPVKDIHGNPLSFEYGLSTFKDYQILLVQEPPERTPVGQLPRSVEVIVEEDLVEKVKPGDRIQSIGVFKCVSTQSTSHAGVFRTVLLASSISLFAEDYEKKITGEELSQFKALSKRKDFFEILANSFAPSIFGHDYVKKALILQLLGGAEKNLENGTHLRGDINVLLVGDPSTAKSQFLRHMMSIAKNAINTTGRGSTGVGLTAAVVIDKDTGEKHLEAGAMVLGDKGVVCIDEFDKMNEIDRVAIHEVMEQQTVTIAKAGIHCSLNARCSVLAAANPAYGEYQKDLSAAKNINLPDSLLSRFDLVFIVLDEESSEMDRMIADRVVRNHMYPSDTPTLLNILDERYVEPDLNMEDGDQSAQVFEKYNQQLHGKNKKEILTKQFLKKFLHYAKIGPYKSDPVLTNDAVIFISDAWTKLRSTDHESSNNFRAVPLTVRTLETLIRLSTAHAKLRLSKTVERADCEVALELLNFALYHDEIRSEAKDVEMEEEEEVEVDHDEEVEDDNENLKTNKKTPHRGQISERTRAKTKNTSDVKKSKNIIDEEEEVARFEIDEADKTDKKSKKSSGKKTKGNEEIDKIFSGKVSENVTEEQKKFVFKLIYDSVHNTLNKQISLEDLWTKAQKNKQFNKFCTNKADFEEIILALDIDSKILFSQESNAIILI
jgi:DNA replication licensing factor MCM3